MQKIHQNNDSFRLRKAAGSDLAELKAMYGRIIEKMNADGIAIWDDFYPCELFENDIRDQQLYVLTDGGTIVSAFTLLDDISGSSSVEWQLSSDLSRPFRRKHRIPPLRDSKSCARKGSGDRTQSRGGLPQTFRGRHKLTRNIALRKERLYPRKRHIHRYY